MNARGYLLEWFLTATSLRNFCARSLRVDFHSAFTRFKGIMHIIFAPYMHSIRAYFLTNCWDVRCMGEVFSFPVSCIARKGGPKAFPTLSILTWNTLAPVYFRVQRVAGSDCTWRSKTISALYANFVGKDKEWQSASKRYLDWVAAPAEKSPFV